MLLFDCLTYYQQSLTPSHTLGNIGVIKVLTDWSCAVQELYQDKWYTPFKFFKVPAKPLCKDVLGSPVSGHQPDFDTALCGFDPAVRVGWEPAVWPQSIFLSPHAAHARRPGPPGVRGACALCQALDGNPHQDHYSWVCVQKFLQDFTFSRWNKSKMTSIWR